MKTNIEYLLPLAYGDPAEVTMVSRNVGDNFLAFSYRIVNSHTQKIAARAETINVCNDGDAQKIEEIKDRANYIASSANQALFHATGGGMAGYRWPVVAG